MIPKVYSTFDFKSVYYQIPIAPEERKYTAFEADGDFLQYTVIPMGVTNGVSAFQRVVNKIIKDNNLDLTWAYLDNVTVGGLTQEEHDKNVKRFLDVCTQYGLTLNHDKTVSSVRELNVIGYLISHLTLKPDPERMRPLVKLTVPTDSDSLKRALGLFSYYSKWVEQFSDKVRPLTQDPQFPLPDSAVAAFNQLKKDIANSSLACPNGRDQLVLETDASDVALSASLNQNGRPIAFFSRTLQSHEKRHPAIEKEAAAIIEACRRWRHYLVNSKFKLVTDQQSVSYIFNSADHGMTKNHKIERWRAEISCLDFDIQYRPGADNFAADCLSRVVIAAVSSTENELKRLHEGLTHPGESRLYHFVRARNQPYTMEDVKCVTSHCQTCAKLKPRFYKPCNPPLIKATQPLERLAVDFKGPLPSVTHNNYLLTVVDEYSRFPWAFACKNMTAKTVTNCLDQIFSLCGHAGFIHSDNGPAFLSKELHEHLLKNGIGHSFSSSYNPRGNGQVERYNGTIWRGIQLALDTDGLETKYWEMTIPAVLHSIRTLVCTATNETPHERIFRFERRTMIGHALPTWLLNKDRALVRKQVRKSKYDDWVEECEILHFTPTYAQIRTQSGKEQTVSLRDLAPLPTQSSETVDEEVSHPPEPVAPLSELVHHELVMPSEISPPVPEPAHESPVHPSNPQTSPPTSDNPPSVSPPSCGEPRRSGRARSEVSRLEYDKLGGTNFMTFMHNFTSG